MVELFKKIVLPLQQENYIHYVRYKNFIESRPIRNTYKESGYEIHHICPKSMGGSDEIDNLIKLSYREHFIAHMILFYCKYPQTISAFHFMIHNNRYDKTLSSKQYLKVKEERIEQLRKSTLGENNSFYGKTHSEETILILREASTGKLQSEETKRKKADALKGVPRPQEVKDKISNSLTGKYVGENSNCFGLKKTPEDCKNIAKRQTGSGNSMARSVICIETNEVFGSFVDAAQKMYGDKNLSRYISRSIHSKTRKQVKGYSWKYQNVTIL